MIETGVTLVQASTLDKEFRKKAGRSFNKDTAREVGKRIAARAKELNIGKWFSTEVLTCITGRSRLWPTAPVKADWIFSLAKEEALAQ